MPVWGVMVVASLLGTSLPEVERGGVRDAAARGIFEVSRLAGLRDAHGDVLGEPLPVEIIQQGGPLWVRDQAEATAKDDLAFAPGQGPHQLQVEVVSAWRTHVLQVRLWRRGWSLKAPRPVWTHAAPWVLVFAAAAGAGVARIVRRPGWALAVMGLVGQLLAAALPWPPGLVVPTLTEVWTTGPLASMVMRHVQALPDIAVAVGWGVVVLCSLLMLFDHRRSRGRGGWMLISGVFGALGCLAFVEAALRVGVVPWLGQPAGLMGLVGLVGLWLGVVRRTQATTTRPAE